MTKAIQIDIENLRNLLKEKTVIEAAEILKVSVDTIYRNVRKHKIDVLSSVRVSSDLEAKLMNIEYMQDLLSKYPKREIAKMFNINVITLNKRLKKIGIGIKYKLTTSQETKNKLNDLGWLKSQVESKSLNQISKELGDISPSGIRYHCVKNNISIPNNYLCKDELYNDIEWIKNKLKNVSMSQIARELDITPSTLLKHCQKNGIDTSLKPNIPEQLKNPEWLISEYIDKKKSITTIAKELKCPFNTVKKYILNSGYETDKNKYTSRISLDLDIIQEKIKNGYSVKELALKFNINRRLMYKILDRENIKYDKISSRIDKNIREKINNKEWLNSQLQKYTISEISKQLGCSYIAVLERVEKFKIKNEKDDKINQKLKNKQWLSSKIYS